MFRIFLWSVLTSRSSSLPMPMRDISPGGSWFLPSITWMLIVLRPSTWGHTAIWDLLWSSTKSAAAFYSSTEVMLEIIKSKFTFKEVEWPYLQLLEYLGEYSLLFHVRQALAGHFSSWSDLNFKSFSIPFVDGIDSRIFLFGKYMSLMTQVIISIGLVKCASIYFFLL